MVLHIYYVTQVSFNIQYMLYEPISGVCYGFSDVSALPYACSYIVTEPCTYFTPDDGVFMGTLDTSDLNLFQQQFPELFI